jgi:hypothetical protein
MTVEDFIATLENSPELSLDTAEEASNRILENILRAETDDDLWAASEGSLLSFREALGEPLEVLEITPRQSRYEQGLGYYFAVKAVNLKTNVSKMYASGSHSVMAQLFNLQRRGRIPGVRVLPYQKPEPTAAGYYPMFLQPVQGELAETAGK